jgi:hypothetical protein
MLLDCVPLIEIDQLTIRRDDAPAVWAEMLEARVVWAIYKQLTDNKPLKDATRDDGRKVVEHFEGQNIKSATIKKKVHCLSNGTGKFTPSFVSAPRMRHASIHTAGEAESDNTSLPSVSFSAQ